MSFKCKIGLHTWDECKCAECGKFRNEQHDWSIDCEKCSVCGKTRKNQHNWNNCKCITCGKENHSWHPDSEGCIRCGKIIEIATLNDLQLINNDLTAHYCLIANIDATETKEWNDGKGFNPIDNSFKGILNGRNYTLRNLFINRPEETNVGLFKCVEGIVKNINLSDVKIIGKNIVGSLVGLNYESTILGCKSSGEVTGEESVGGLVGVNDARSNILKCYSSVIVSGNVQIGGLAGTNKDGSNIIECSSSCKVLANKYDGGGIAGINIKNSNISFCMSSGNISGESGIGGLVGTNMKDSTILSCISTCHVSGERFLGGLIANNLDADAHNSYWDIQTSGITLSKRGYGKTTKELQQQITFKNWDFENIWQIDDGKSYPTLKALHQSDKIEEEKIK
jgi:hypothetical protein